MTMEFNTLDDIDVYEKTVLLRVDFNMPLDKDTKKILDTTRIKRVLPTFHDLIEKKAKIVVIAHQGRKGSWDFTSMKQHAETLESILDHEVRFIEDIEGDTAQTTIRDMQPGEIIFLDNVRKLAYETDKRSAEEHAQSPFVQHLAPISDVFVNDAFAAAHRPQCSLIGFTPVLTSAAGRLMEKEIQTLSQVMQNPDKPCMFLFGGAKFSDIIVTIERILQNNTADHILLTGLPANAFLKAKGYELGIANEKVLQEEGSAQSFQEIKDLVDNYEDVLSLPMDFAIENNTIREEITIDDLPSTQPLFDIGTKTINAFKQMLSQAKTIFLSGPCGVFEHPLFMRGTEEIFTYVSASDAFSIVGGGHTVAAVTQLGLEKQVSHISTGGGSLEKFMMGEKLPVIEALKMSKQKHVVTS